MDKRKLLIRYLAGDFIAANLAWMAFTILRFYLIGDVAAEQGFHTLSSYLHAPFIMMGQAAFPLLMIFIAYLSGYYNSLFFKSRLQEFTTTITSTFITAILLFFIILINDLSQERSKNYELVLTMWGCLFSFIYAARLFTTEGITRKIHDGRLRFNTLILGVNPCAMRFYESLKNAHKSMGYSPCGFVRLPGETTSATLPTYDLKDVDEACSTLHIDHIIIVPDKQDRNDLLTVINSLLHLNIPVKITPELYDILTIKVHHGNILGEPLIDIAQSGMSDSQKCIKRTLDVAGSIMALLLLSPVFAAVAIAIKCTTGGSVFYKQERIGRHGHPFTIYKFRSMVADAEKDSAPQLSSPHDDRITAVGKILRKYRIDEIPQFWNVVIGDMSIVGPRPERRYFVERILKQAPYYTLLYQVRPGITSWGMVRFGYASDVEQMIERSKYDLLYIENMSLLIDLKIIIYTIRTVVSGKGL